jgi:type IV fimbrial biogenesis protein FimT
MFLRAHPIRGFTLIELMVSLAVLSVLVAVALPNYAVWVQNSRIRTTAESITSGLTLARSEAIRRNAMVQFNLVNEITSACALTSTGTAATGTSWVVSRGNPAGHCDAAPIAVDDTGAPTAADPKIIQVRGAAEASQNVVFDATNSAGAAATTVTFDGLGRVSAAAIAASVAQINVDVPTTVLPAADSRDLRIVVAPAGQIRLCDPAVTSTTDPRHC